MRKLTPLEKFDTNLSGDLSAKELEAAERILELELREQKSDTQRRMTWVSLWAMIIFTAVLFSPLVTDTRINSLADLFGLFYISVAGIAASYMGAQAWLSNQTTANQPSYELYRRKKGNSRIDDVEGDEERTYQ